MYKGIALKLSFILSGWWSQVWLFCFNLSIYITVYFSFFEEFLTPFLNNTLTTGFNFYYIKSKAYKATFINLNAPGVMWTKVSLFIMAELHLGQKNVKSTWSHFFCNSLVLPGFCSFFIICTVLYLNSKC
jgi:hypothetical protein